MGVCFYHKLPINSMPACVIFSQFHGGTLCSEAGPLATSHSIALTFSWWPRYRTLCSSLAGKLNTHTPSPSLSLFHTSPTPIYSVTPWQVNSGARGRKKMLLVLLDRWRLGLHLMYMASIDPGNTSIILAWRSVRDFLASLHVFLVFMGTWINLTASTNIVAGNHLDIYSIKLPPLEPL